jgi:nitrate reductase delta subunit
VLAQYPDERVLGSLPEAREAVAALPAGTARRALERVLSHLSSTPPAELARAYVETFDFSRRCSPYLTYATRGDTRARGMALLRLRDLYRAGGLELRDDAAELPDHLTIVLEFAALAPDGFGTAVLRELRPGLELLRGALVDRGSPYADLLTAACAGLPRLGVKEANALRRVAREGPPSESVGLEPFPPSTAAAPEARA